MKKDYLLAFFSLGICLFIYLFYRTEQTIINQIFIAINSVETFIEAQHTVQKRLPLPDVIVYSLPEALWIFCITLTSKSLYLKFGKLQFNMVYLPLILIFTFEFSQLFHFTNGQFDVWDIALSLVFWILAKSVVKSKTNDQNMVKPFNYRTLICVFSCLIVFFSHVIY